MYIDGEVSFFVIGILAWFGLVFHLSQREVGKTKFDKNSDDQKYTKWVQAHYFGAALFSLAYGILRFSLHVLIGT